MGVAATTLPSSAATAVTASKRPPCFTVADVTIPFVFGHTAQRSSHGFVHIGLSRAGFLRLEAAQIWLETTWPEAAAPCRFGDLSASLPTVPSESQRPCRDLAGAASFSAWSLQRRYLYIGRAACCWPQPAAKSERLPKAGASAETAKVSHEFPSLVCAGPGTRGRDSCFSNNYANGSRSGYQASVVSTRRKGAARTVIAIPPGPDSVATTRTTSQKPEPSHGTVVSRTESGVREKTPQVDNSGSWQLVSWSRSTVLVQMPAAQRSRGRSDRVKPGPMPVHP